MERGTARRRSTRCPRTLRRWCDDGTIAAIGKRAQLSLREAQRRSNLVPISRARSCPSDRFVTALLTTKTSPKDNHRMNVLFHNTAGPDLAARLAAIPYLRITACPEDND